VQSILGNKRVTGVRLSSGRELKADMVIVSIGISPNTSLAKKAGLRISSTTGGVIIDRYQRVTDDSNIFACGDCATKVSYFSGKPVRTWLASVATTEARITAVNLFGAQCHNLGTLGVFSTQIGELVIGAAGLTQRQAEADGFDVVIGEAKAPSKHPGAMPGAVPTSVKLIFSRCGGVLIGGEASGGAPVGELINVISACIQKRMTAHEVSLFQMGTHPALCSSPMAYQIVNAAEQAVVKLK
jgi:pyruvate/2-oxoglutarate dehydrogenase complex dihydrolipoamide dehydrogenase (E3) component